MGIKNKLFKYWLPDSIVSAKILRMPPSSGIVLMYHEVLPDNIDFPAWTVARESDFRWQISYLKENFDIVSIDEAFQRATGKKQGDRPFAVITFDDGYSGNFKYVLPIMESMRAPFTVYVSTKAIIENNLFWYDKIISLLNLDKTANVKLKFNGKNESFLIPAIGRRRRWRAIRNLLEFMKDMPKEKREALAQKINSDFGGVKAPFRMLSEKELLEISRSEFVTIGCHSHSHDLLDELEPHEVIESIKTSITHIKRITGLECRHFSYPNGNFNEEVISTVQKSGFATAVTTSSGLWTSSASPFKIPRIGVGRFDTENIFKSKIYFSAS